MKLYDENKNLVGEIERPEPSYYENVWYEFMEYRKPKKDEILFPTISCFPERADEDDCLRPFWIASEIPRATAEQLRVINMKERDGRPVVLNEGDMIWAGGGNEVHQTFKGYPSFNHFRFVLVPDVQKEIHTSCEGCKRALGNGYRDWDVKECEVCFPDMAYEQERKNYTPKVKDEQPDEPKFSMKEVMNCVCAILRDYEETHYASLCGMIEDKLKTVLTERSSDEPRFSLKEINDWLGGFYLNQLTHPGLGIKAFTERRRG